jgi:CubicO group peptidase (beta-lactamase class C family)
MHGVLAGYVEREEVPGFVALISRHGEVHVDCIAYERDTIFRIASMSKPIVAAAACVLVEEGLLRLDDPIDPFIPELADVRVLPSIAAAIEDTVPVNRPITLRDLLAFTLGTGMVVAEKGTYPIQDAIDRAEIHKWTRRGRLAEEYLRLLSALPLVHQPGEAWMYNTGSDVLGILVARAAQQPLGEFLGDRIFEPLGLADTGFWVPAENIARLPTAYAPEAGGLEVDDHAKGGGFARPPLFESGAGGLVSTVDDFLRFARMLLGGGVLDGHRILARPSVEAMTTDQLTPEQKSRSPWLPGYWDTHGWGWGVGVVNRRSDITSTPGQYGWDGGFGTTWRSDPREGMISILMTQVSPPEGMPIFRDFYTLAYAAIDD